DVKGLTESCFACQARKRPIKMKGPLHTVTATQKLEHVQIDLCSGLPVVDGYVAVMVITDIVTKHVVLVPLKDKTALSVGQGFWAHYVRHYGFPHKVQTDRRHEFTSHFALSFFKAAGNKVQSTALHPQSQGVVERFNCTPANMLSKLVGQHQDGLGTLPV
ncbi:MAG: hypothetical protein ACK56F_05110, partial [bacterium]